MVIKTFKDILTWKKAHALVLRVYKITDNFPQKEIFVLVSQMRRCAISIPSNIVESFKRRTKNDSIHFYNIAEGSLEELKYQLILAKDLKYISKKEFNEVYNLAEEVGKLVNGWKRVQK